MEHYYNYFFDENDTFYLVDIEEYKKFKHHYSLYYFDNMKDDFDYYEVYNPNKQYNYEIFKKDYGNGELTYQFGLFYIVKQERYYVCAFRILDEEEKKELDPYCECLIHTGEKELFGCKLTVKGCVNLSDPTQGYIKSATQNKLQSQDILYKKNV